VDPQRSGGRRRLHTETTRAERRPGSLKVKRSHGPRRHWTLSRAPSAVHQVANERPAESEAGVGPPRRLDAALLEPLEHVVAARREAVPCPVAAR